MSRLTDARAALETVRFELDQDGQAKFCKTETDALRAALARMAQLEKVAELARRLDLLGQGPRADRAALLDMALAELDHHYPETKE